MLHLHPKEELFTTWEASHSTLPLLPSSEAMHTCAHINCRCADLVRTPIHNAWKQALTHAGHQMTLSDTSSLSCAGTCAGWQLTPERLRSWLRQPVSSVTSP